VSIDALFNLKAEDVFEINPQNLDLQLGVINHLHLTIKNKLSEQIELQIPTISGMEFAPSGSITLAPGGTRNIDLSTTILDSPSQPSLRFAVGDMSHDIPINWTGPPWDWREFIVGIPVLALLMLIVVVWRFWPNKELRW